MVISATWLFPVRSSISGAVSVKKAVLGLPERTLLMLMMLKEASQSSGGVSLLRVKLSMPLPVLIISSSKDTSLPGVTCFTSDPTTSSLTS